MNKIDKTAIISPGAKIGESCSIGPFCIVGENCVIGDNVELKSHVVIDGHTTIGSNNTIYPFASIGAQPQDLKYKGEDSKLVIGDGNIMREYVTMQPGTKGGGMVTKLGSNSLFMVGVHIAHDCHVGDNVILANYANLAGHVVIEDNVRMGGLSAIAQHVRVGHHAMIGGLTGVTSNVVPFAMVTSKHGYLDGLNLVGMSRAGFPRSESLQALEAVDMIFSKDDIFANQILKTKDKYKSNRIVMQILDFIKSLPSSRLCMPPSNKKS